MAARNWLELFAAAKKRFRINQTPYSSTYRV